MTNDVHITAVPKDPPDLDQFVAALLALAIYQLERERNAASAEQEEGRHDD